MVKSKLFVFILSVITIFVMTPLSASAADEVSYMDRSWNGSEVVETETTESGCSAVTAGTTTMSSGWYYVTGSVTISSRLKINGDVNLILTDGCTLTCSKGIRVPEGKTFNVYGQSGDTGKLIAKTSDSERSGIGGDCQDKIGAINIYGGTITAQGGSYGAGIGAAADNVSGDVKFGANKTITILGGNVTAQGGGSSPGIGCAHGGPVGTVTIRGGFVNATGGDQGSGIGSGWFSGRGTNDYKGKLYISGGTVTAKGGNKGAGIGGGLWAPGIDTYITGGTITAIAGKDHSKAIGTGKNSEYESDHVLELYNEAMVTAGSNSDNAVKATSKNRVSSCRTAWAKIEPCTHSDADIADVGNGHTVQCVYCTAQSGGVLDHDYGDDPCRCSVCGHERISVTFDAGAGTGTMDPVYIDKGSEYELPDSAFTPPESSPVFCGWIIESRQYPAGSVFTFDEDIVLTAAYGDPHNVWIGTEDNEVQITDANKDDVLGDGTMTYDPETCTLDCKGASVHATLYDNAIRSDSLNLTITGSLEAVTDRDAAAIKVTKGSLILDGDITGSGYIGMKADWDVIIRGGNIAAIPNGDHTMDRGIEAGRGIDIQNGIESVHAYGSNTNRGAIYAENYSSFFGKSSLDLGSGLYIKVPEGGRVFDDPVKIIDADRNVASEVVLEKKYFTVSCDGSGAEGTMDAETLLKGTDFTIPECGFTVPEGQLFIGWQAGDKTYQPGDVVDLQSDLELAAIWHDANCTMTFIGGEGCDETTSVVIPYGSDYELPGCSFTAPEGKDFYRWIEDDPYSHPRIPGYVFSNVKEDKVFTASWKDHVHNNLANADRSESSCTETGMEEHWECEGCDLWFADENAESVVRPEELVIELTGHDSLKKVDRSEPSCNESGIEEHWECEDCGLWFADENAETAVTPAELAIEPTGHDWKAVGDPEYSDDNRTVTVHLVCRKDDSHVSTETYRSMKDKAVVLSSTSYTYNGKSHTPSIRTIDGKTLTKDVDYTVSYSASSRINAGTYTVTVKGKGAYYGESKATYKINRASNPMTIKGKTVKVKYGKVKKASRKLSQKSILSISSHKGTLTYKKVKGSKKIVIAKSTGKLTVKKGLKKGTYKVKIAVTDSQSKNYKAKTLTRTVTVKVVK